MSIKIIHTIDWYDGEVSAIFSKEGGEGLFFCSLIACDIESDHRVYGCIPISYPIDELTKLLDLPSSESNWLRIRSIVASIVESHNGDIEIRDTNSTFTSSVSRQNVDGNLYKSQLGHPIEFAIKDYQTSLWLRA